MNDLDWLAAHAPSPPSWWEMPDPAGPTMRDRRLSGLENSTVALCRKKGITAEEPRLVEECMVLVLQERRRQAKEREEDMPFEAARVKRVLLVLRDEKAHEETMNTFDFMAEWLKAERAWRYRWAAGMLAAREEAGT